PLLLVVPPVPIATADAYRSLDSERGRPAPPAPRVIRPDALGSWAALAADAANDFEAVLFRQHPELARLRDALEAHGARPARRTGSGSAVFGIFESAEKRGAAAAEVARAFPHGRLIETLTGEAQRPSVLG